MGWHLHSSFYSRIRPAIFSLLCQLSLLICFSPGGSPSVQSILWFGKGSLQGWRSQSVFSRESVGSLLHARSKPMPALALSPQFHGTVLGPS